MCGSRWHLRRKRRRLPEPPWSKYIGKSEKRKPPTRNGRSRSSTGSGSMMPCKVWRGKGLSDRTSITGSAKPLEPVLTLSLTPWDGANMSGPGRGHMRVPHGPETYGAPVPWTTNSWPREWSACGA